MGYNTTIVLLNDHLESVRNEHALGERLHDAVLSLSRGKMVRVGGGIQVIETHHADALVPVLVGGNCGQVLDASVHWSADDVELALLKRLAEKRGFRLAKKKAKP